MDKWVEAGYGPGGGAAGQHAQSGANRGYWVSEKCLQCMPKQNGWVTHYYQVKCNNCGGEGGWHEEEQYECEHDCGYVGSYVDVERHELTCPYLVDDY